MRFRVVKRLASRAVLWMRILKQLQGVSVRTGLALIASAVMDTIVFGLRPDSAVSPKSYFSGIVRSKKFHCCWKIRKGTDDIYNILPEREGDVHELILSSLERGDIFADVGANIGYYSILGSKRVGPNGIVIAFEPMPETFQCLETNCKLNNSKNVILIPKAAWDAECRTPLFFSGGYYGMASMTNPTGDSILVEATTLDNICEPYSHIKVLKIDVEGAEYQVLCGAGETLKKTKHVILECSQHCDKIISLLQSKGFNIRKLAFTTYILAEKPNEQS